MVPRRQIVPWPIDMPPTRNFILYGSGSFGSAPSLERLYISESVHLEFLLVALLRRMNEFAGGRVASPAIQEDILFSHPRARLFRGFLIGNVGALNKYLSVRAAFLKQKRITSNANGSGRVEYCRLRNGRERAACMCLTFMTLLRCQNAAAMC